MISIRKSLKSLIISALGKTLSISEWWRRHYAFAHLQAAITGNLDTTVVIHGRADVHGTGNITFGNHVTLYRELLFETWGTGKIDIGNNVLICRGVHTVSMASITIGDGTMIGEYASIRDQNHARTPGKHLRDSGYHSSPIVIGTEVWIGRGVVILPGVTIGDGATIGANAVVTKNVEAGSKVAGVPAKTL